MLPHSIQSCTVLSCRFLTQGSKSLQVSSRLLTVCYVILGATCVWTWKYDSCLSVATDESLCACVSVCKCGKLSPRRPITGYPCVKDGTVSSSLITDRRRGRGKVLFVPWRISSDNWERRAVLSEELAKFADEHYVTEAAWKLGQTLCTMLCFLVRLWNTLKSGKQCHRLTAVVI